MRERRMTPEKAITSAVISTAAGIAVAEILGITTRNPIVDISAFIAVANVAGVPATPILQAIREKLYPGQKALKKEPEN